MDVPNELLFATFSHLDVRSLERTSRVCRLFHAIVGDMRATFQHTYENLKQYVVLRRTHRLFDLAAERRFLATAPVRSFAEIQRSWPCAIQESVPTRNVGCVVFVVCSDPRRLADHVNALAHALISGNDYHRILDTRGVDCPHRPRKIRDAAPQGMVRRIPITLCGLTSAYCLDLIATNDHQPSLYIFHWPLFQCSGSLGWLWMGLLAKQNVDCVVGMCEELPDSILNKFALYQVHREYNDLDHAHDAAAMNTTRSCFHKMYLWDTMFATSIEKS